MVTKVLKWGNSLGLRIPKAYADEARVEDGSVVDISIRNGVLVVRPVRRRKYSLVELLGTVKASNLHAEVTSTEPAGREAW
jgi:antitoxin MazE